MPSDTPPPPLVISRRDLLRTAGAVGAAAITAGAPGIGDDASGHAQTVPVPTPTPREAYERLTAREADTLEAVVARLIPSDANGPGATEARATHYIDRALAGALAASLEAYRLGLTALDRHAVASRGRPFGQLVPGDQDTVLMELETGTAVDQGFVGGSSTFFAMVKGHTWQGTFGDPYYGGNAGFVGWDLLGYPGVRTMVTEDDQRQLERRVLPANHRLAYDYAGFTKATAQSVSPDAHTHGD